MQVLQGTLNVLILNTLADGALHGYAIVERIRAASSGELEIEEGALYHALHRMEARGWLSPDWRSSENNRRAKYYALTPAGRRQLAREAKAWGRYGAFLARVLHAKGGRS
jgi:transcriptional regulator